MKAVFRMLKKLSGPLAVLFWLGVWQAAALFLDSRILLVSPVTAIATLLRLMGEGSFYAAVFLSVRRILWGFLLAALAASVLSALAARFFWARALLSPLMQAVKATPVASFVVLALLFFSSSRLSTFMSFLMALPILYTNTLTGFLSADRKLIEMADIFRLSPITRARVIYIPAAFPYFLSGCTVSLGVCWKAGVAAEVIGLPAGSIGEKLYDAKIFLDTPEMFAWTLAVILISLLFEKLLIWIMRLAQKRMGAQ